MNPWVIIAFNINHKMFQINFIYEIDQHGTIMFYRSIEFGNTTHIYYIRNILPDASLEFWGKMIKNEAKQSG